MEADWEFEIGNDAPIIAAHWQGYVDLRAQPERANELVETLQLAGLAEALRRLNAPRSTVWTCKTDVFVPDQLDPDELDATGDEAAFGLACYVDIVPCIEKRWDRPAKAERWCRELCTRLHDIQLQRSRVDLVVRHCPIDGGLQDLGATAYLIGCGPTQSDARSRLAECLSQFTEAIVPKPNSVQSR